MNKNRNDEVCEPIDDLDMVLKYKNVKKCQDNNFIFRNEPFVVQNTLKECHQELNTLSCKQRLDQLSVPKTLVCHDYKGGYKEDKYINGCDSGNGYTFYRWSYIDVFVYFSHHFVTIPPPGWIITAHRNNVKVLGTIITEGDAGKALCDKIFASDDSWRDFAKSLVNICSLHDFDGWFLNVENDVTDTKPLLRFIEFLTEEIHKLNPEYLVLWYDSIKEDGVLLWQNELNNTNKCFFDVCDGIFLNYCWTSKNLLNSAQKAGPRLMDVYVGIDVFGRGCYGGGGFNCHAAANQIRKHGLSLAVFAPGWTHENINKDITQDFFRLFCQRDLVLWLNLYPYLYRKPIHVPFTTSFHLGSDKGCYYLNSQEKMLSRPMHCGTNDELQKALVEKCDCMQLNPEGCKSNTMSCLISDVHLNETNKYIHKIITCNIGVKFNFVVAYVYKKLSTNVDDNLEIIALTRDKVGRYHSIYFMEKSGLADVACVKPLTDNDLDMAAAQRAVNFGDILDGWIARYYIYAVPKPMTICDVFASVNGSSVLLGAFSIQTEIVS